MNVVLLNATTAVDPAVDQTLLGGLFLFLGVGLLLAVAAGFSLFFFYAIATFRIAKKEGYDKPWLAWIPFVNLLLIPILTEQDVHAELRGRFTAVYAAAFVAAVLLGGFVPFIGLVPTVLTIYGFYFLVARYSENAAVYTVIAGMTLTASIPVQLFRMRKRERRYTK